MCPYCKQPGCSPTCGDDGRVQRVICPDCGSRAVVFEGALSCDSCGYGHAPASPFDTDPESAANRRFTLS